ncbi:hypothetical protein DY000_02052549 [Brassica cretica]|uniref:Uncharacterized protein n=1 Tax=Brassica cretica TaxID=69181 RepID=A0ABQ7AHG5_BRACR|nr:hypothetical protein DY000_02052549 [Brassica cretica]
MEPSQDSFTFMDKSKANSAGLIKNVKVEIGDCTIPVDFHVVEIKLGKTSSLVFGRAFMATVGAVCDLKRNKMYLTNVDDRVFYDHVEKKKSEEFISCIEMFEGPAPTSNSNHEPAKPVSPSVDIQHAESVVILPGESIDIQPFISIDTLRISEQSETEKPKSGGKTRKRKKKKKKECRCRFHVTSPFAMSRGKS